MNDQKGSSKNSERRGPPMPAFLFKIMNPLMKALLYSPFHGGVSKSLMLLSFTGRKSGKKFTIPVGYLRKDNTLIVFTHSNWWKNLRDGAPVTLRIQGKKANGVGRPVSDPAAIKAMVHDLIAANGEARARQMGFWVEDAHTSPEEIQKAVAGTTFIHIRLENV